MHPPRAWRYAVVAITGFVLVLVMGAPLAAAATPSHPLSHIFPMDTNLNMSNNPNAVGYNLTNLPWINPAGTTLNLGGDLNMRNNNIYSFFQQSQCSGDQVVKKINPDGTYVCDTVSADVEDQWVDESGDAMSGNLNMQGNDINNVQNLELGWTNLTDYPGCADGEAIRVLGDNLTCTDLQPGGEVNGSGSATEVAYFTDNDSISSNSNLYFDTINYRLGLQTSNPQAPLDVRGNADIRGTLDLYDNDITNVNALNTDALTVSNQSDIAVFNSTHIRLNDTVQIWNGNLSLNNNALLNVNWANSDDGPGSGLDADTLDGIDSPAFIRGDAVNNGGSTIRVDAADFSIEDSTDSVPKYFWYDNSEDTLFLGTQNAMPTLRASLNVSGNNLTKVNEIQDFFSQTCSGSDVVQKIFDNGTVVCTDPAQAGTENLSETLKAGNSAGQYDVDLNGNALRNASNITGFYNGNMVTLQPTGTVSGEYGWAMGQVQLNEGRLDIEPSGGITEIRVGGTNTPFNIYNKGSGSYYLQIDSNQNVKIPNGNLNMSGNNITDINELQEYFGSACPDEHAVAEIYPNGTLRCIDTVTDETTEAGLPGTLAINNTANQSIDMNGNNIALNGGYLSNDGDNEGVTVDDQGQVGVGADNPQSQLEVDGSTNLSSGGTSMEVQGDGDVVITLGS